MTEAQAHQHRPLLAGFEAEVLSRTTARVEYTAKGPAVLFDRLFVQSLVGELFVLRKLAIDGVELPNVVDVPCDWFGAAAGDVGAPGQPLQFPSLRAGQTLALWFENITTGTVWLRGVLSGVEVYGTSSEVPS